MFHSQSQHVQVEKLCVLLVGLIILTHYRFKPTSHTHKILFMHDFNEKMEDVDCDCHCGFDVVAGLRDMYVDDY